MPIEHNTDDYGSEKNGDKIIPREIDDKDADISSDENNISPFDKEENENESNIARAEEKENKEYTPEELPKEVKESTYGTDDGSSISEPAKETIDYSEIKGNTEEEKGRMETEKKRFRLWKGKKKEKTEKKESLKEKTEKKITETVHRQFHGIFDRDKIPYTLIFFIGVSVITVMSLFGGVSDPTAVMRIMLFITVSFVLMFLILLPLSMIPAMYRFMFDEKRRAGAFITMGIAGGIAVLLTALYFYWTDPSRVFIRFMSYQVFLPALFVIIFLGWNLIQVHFIKDAIGNVAEKIEYKILDDETDPSVRRKKSIPMVIPAVLVPVLIITLTVIGFYFKFTEFADPSNPSAEEIAALIQFWVAVGFFYIMFGLTAVRFFRLYSRSSGYGRPNVYISMMFMFFWFLLWFRMYSFLNSFRSVVYTTGSDVFVVIGDVFLLILTAVMALRGMADRVKKTTILSEDVLPFLVYALTLMYIAGEIVLILNPETFGSRNQVNILNNLLVFIATALYYLWYAEYGLRMKGYLPRKFFEVDELKSALEKMKEDLMEKFPERTEEIAEMFEKFYEKYNI